MVAQVEITAGARHGRAARGVALSPLLLLCLACDAQGLTIYRIGSGPPPDLEVPHEFVQWTWAEAATAPFGQLRSLDLTPDHIAPRRLDAAVNIAPSIAQNGGRTFAFGNYETAIEPSERERAAWDGNRETAYLGHRSILWRWMWSRQRNIRFPPSKYWVFDLGGLFVLEKIRFYPRDRFRFERVADSFIVGVSDGDSLKTGTRDLRIAAAGFDFDTVYDISENNSALVELPLPPRPIRQLLLALQRNVNSFWELAEIEIYGAGYSAFARYESAIIDLGGARSLGPLAWAGAQPAEERVELRMRHGDDDDPNAYWRTTFRGGEKTRLDHEGRVLTRASYGQLQLGERAGTTYDAKNWSDWSAPVALRAATPLATTRPRRYVQLRADFHSTPESAGRLQYLQFAASPPRVARIEAEIAPTRVGAGRMTAFTYTLRPRFEGNEPGFDRVTIDAPGAVAGVDGVRINGADVAFAVERRDDAGFSVALPRIDARRTEDLIEIDFRAEVFQYGTTFSGRVSDSASPHELPQAVSAGDADGLGDGGTLQVVLTQVQQRPISRIALSSPVCTPDGDGINDRVEFTYDLINIEGAAPVRIDLYSLDGRRRRTFAPPPGASGRFTGTWDGRDDRGALLAPGLYLLRVRVAAGQGSHQGNQLVALAY